MQLSVPVGDDFGRRLRIHHVSPDTFTLARSFDFMRYLFDMDRDANATTMFVVGSTFGEAIIPVCMGLIMHASGPQALMYCTLAISMIMATVYVAAHYLMGKDGKRHKQEMKHPPDSSQSPNGNTGEKADVLDIELMTPVGACSYTTDDHPGLVNGKSLYLS